MTSKLVSIIIPVFNEEDNIERAYEAIVKELEQDSNLQFEIIFTDNHSTDSTFKHIQQLALRDKRVKALRFVRNFGFNRSILTGYRCAIGDAAIQIDCDLEDPPRLMHDFIRLWREGHDVVVGVRAKRQESWLMISTRKFFYKFLDSISETHHQMDGGDFRLVDRNILNQLKIINDAQPYIRGLISELSCNQVSVAYTRNRREHGKSKFPLFKLITFGLEAIFANSVLPMKVATFIGIGIALVTALASAVYIIVRMVSPEIWPAGFATTTILILFGISLNALFIGILGEYVARIYMQVRRRPDVIIEKALNLNISGALYRENTFNGL